jgi:hypothetical protein
MINYKVFIQCGVEACFWGTAVQLGQIALAKVVKP